MNPLLPAMITVFDALPGGICQKLQTIGGWVTSVLGWGAGLAFIVAGGVFCYAYFGGHGSSKAVRALAGVSVGCVLITAGSAIANQLLGGGSCQMN
ncbi:MAG: hypothetical protein ACRDMV_03675 [Streptosporangiales bacterium]